MVSHSGLITVMTRAARKAAPRLRRDFGEVEQLQVSRKGPADFVSMADKRAEQTIVDELRNARPEWGLLVEEAGEIAGNADKPRWIVDPLDGTTNFLHGIPHFAVSIALQREGELVAGLIYNPANGDAFTAERGKGAFFNDRRIRVAARSRLDNCVIATGIPHRGREGHEAFLRQLAAVMTSVSGVRRLGAAALDLAWVAAGRFDGYAEHNLGAWDLAAGSMIVREAGGHVSDVEGGPNILKSGSIVAGNTHIHRALLEVLAAAREAT